MGSLNNLYISQSYQSLLHFATDSGSTATLTEIEDGLGNGLGLYLNSIGSASLDGDMYIGGDLTVSGAFDIEGAIVIRDNVYVTGSIYSSQDISSSRILTGEVTASNMTVAGTLNVYKINTTIESSSVIFSSGSNILGDSLLDTQTLNGTIIVSGSEQVTGSLGVSQQLNVLGSGSFGGNLNVTGEISSSTINGIGNVTTYSQSVDARLDYLEGPFSTSVDLRLDQLENWSSSLDTNFATQAELTTTRSLIESEMSVTQSVLQANINQKLFTSSFNAYTASTDIRLNNLESTSASVNISIANLNTTTASLNIAVSNINAFTQSFSQSVYTRFTYTPTTGSNTFVGTESISGSLNLTGSMGVTGNMIYSGSVRGQVVPLNISATTASMDLSLGNFFTITLNNAGAVRIEPTNIQPGETITLRLTQPAGGYSSVNFPSNVKYPTGYQYSATPSANAVDVITFVTFDTSSLYYSRANQFV